MKFVQGRGLLGWWMMFMSVASLHAQAQPNIVLIMTDDQRWDQIEWMPTLESELIEKGTLFENSFVTTSLCCPSRASILTGLYAFHHGVYTNHVSLFDDSSTLGIWLDDAGYLTGWIGKYFNGYVDMSPLIPPGWDEWYVFVVPGYFDYELNENGTIVPYGADEEDYSTDVLSARAVEFIASAADTPFFLVLATSAPHQAVKPAPRHDGALDGLEPLRLPNFNEEDVSDKPSWIQALPLVPESGQGITIPALDRQRQKQIESLLAVDEMIASVLDALDREGLTDSTVVIFISDNGFSQGEHRWHGKQCAYEESLRVPLVVRVPGQTPVVEPGLALNIDLAPTIADYAGVTPPLPVDGLSLRPLIEQTATSWREDFLAENRQQGQQPVPTFNALRTDEWTYVEMENGETELYDLLNDPFQLDNLASDVAHADLIATLSTRIQAILAGPLGVATEALPSGVVGAAYAAALEAEGGVTPYAWILSAGALPDGLSLDVDSGAIDGTPTTVGESSFTVEVTDADGATASAELGITVGEELAVHSVTPAEVEVDSSVQLTITGQGFDAGTTVAFCPPAGRVVVDQTQFVDSTTLIVDVTVPAEAMTGPCGVRVVTSGGLTATLPQAITLSSGAPAPVLTAVTPDELPAGASLQLTFSGSDFQDGATVIVCHDGRVTIDSVQFVDASTLLVDVTVSPEAALTPCAARVRNPDAQASVLPGAVTIVPGS